MGLWLPVVLQQWHNGMSTLEALIQLQDAVGSIRPHKFNVAIVQCVAELHAGEASTMGLPPLFGLTPLVLTGMSFWILFHGVE